MRKEVLLYFILFFRKKKGRKKDNKATEVADLLVR